MGVGEFDVDEVVEADVAVVGAGLARIEETLYPLASLKGNEEARKKEAYRTHEKTKKDRDRARDAERRGKRR